MLFHIIAAIILLQKKDVRFSDKNFHRILSLFIIKNKTSLYETFSLQTGNPYQYLYSFWQTQLSPALFRSQIKTINDSWERNWNNIYYMIWVFHIYDG